MKSVKIVNTRIVSLIRKHQKQLGCPTAAETVAVIIRDHDTRQTLAAARKAARKSAAKKAGKS